MINSVVNKGNSVYGFLQQNFRSCPAAVKSYQTYLQPVLEYVYISCMVTTLSVRYWQARNGAKTIS